MLLTLFAIRDEKVNVFKNFFFDTNTIQACRGVHIAVNDPQSQLYHFPQDYSLYNMGEMDDQTGKMIQKKEGKEKPEFVANLKSFKQEEGKDIKDANEKKIGG